MTDTFRVYGSEQHGYGVVEVVKNKPYAVYDNEADTPQWVAQEIADIYNKGFTVPDGVEEWDFVASILSSRGIVFGADGKWSKTP